jgi:hypothetical protein
MRPDCITSEEWNSAIETPELLEARVRVKCHYVGSRRQPGFLAAADYGERGFLKSSATFFDAELENWPERNETHHHQPRRRRLRYARKNEIEIVQESTG